MLDLGVVRDDLALVVEVDEVVRVQAVAAVEVLVGVDVAQHEDHAGLQPLVGVGGNDGVQALGRAGQVAVLLDVAEQVHAEVVQARGR